MMITGAMMLSFWSIIFAGVECNECMDGTIKACLHNWQLKLAMTGWTGGFIKKGGLFEDSDDYIGRLPNSAVLELDAEDEERTRDRLNYIIKVRFILTS